MLVVSRRTALAAVAGSVLLPHAVAAQQRPLTPIACAGLPEDSATPVLYAISSGAFKRDGLDVRMEAQRSGPAVATGIAGGAYQIGKVSLNPLIDAHAKRIPLVIVAPGGLSTSANPIAGLMVRADSPIKTAKDLNGKTIGAGALNDIFTLAMRAWMDKNGGDPTSLKFVEIPISALAEAIDQNRIAAGSANEPILGAALASGKVKVIAQTFDAIAPRFMFTAWVATKAWADANSAAAEAFGKVVRASAAFVNAHHDDTVDDIAKFTKLDPATVRKMPRTEAGTSLEPRLIQPVIDAAARFKDIPARFDAKELIWNPA
ncbi:MAG TPA: ABC transporter substrate-binding protein [Candidatus Elarobacter sp.]|nr:ABC transporter substrate-binding protein [Candidatus Elarobacter sp.]